MSPIAVRQFAGHAVYREQLSGPLRIAHITDQHIGRVTPVATQLAAVEAANAADPDVVVLTGDFVAHSLAFLDQLQQVVERFAAPVVAVLGNHDHWSGPDGVRRALRRAGADVLDNRWTALRVRGEVLQIVGLDDAYTGHADRREALRGLDPRRATLGLSHIAEEADGLWAHGVPLVLAGHTHGGQVATMGLPRWTIGALAGHRYVHGLYGDRRGQGAVYVGAGVGSAVLPLRWGDRARPEVAVFELAAQAAVVDDHAEQPALPGRKPSDETRRRRHLAAHRKAWRRARTTPPHWDRDAG